MGQSGDRPRSATREGGSDAPHNLQVLCEDCNAGKSATMPERWLVAETKRLVRGQFREPPEDDYSEMYAYMDAYDELERLPAESVLMLRHARDGRRVPVPADRR